MKRSILRLPSVQHQYGKGRSSIYADIARGLFTRPVKLGSRCAGWPDDEVSQIVDARIAGAAEEEIRRLVERLHEARTSNAPAI